jgi:hypothetical protein
VEESFGEAVRELRGVRENAGGESLKSEVERIREGFNEKLAA